MKTKYFYCLICLFIFSEAWPQDVNETSQAEPVLSEPLQFEQITNIDVGLRSEDLLLQLDYQHIHRLNPENHFRMGYGLAFIHFRSFTNISYYTKGREEDINQGSDTLQVENPFISSLNLFLLLNYALNDRLDFGFSIDMVGIGWGRSQAAAFAVGPDDPDPMGTSAKPARFNSSLFGLGSWRSQLEVRYWIYRRWALHTGLNYWLAAYEVTEDIGLEENAFDRGLLFFKLGLSFRWNEANERDTD